VARIWFVLTIGVLVLVSSGIATSLARAQTSADPTSVITDYETARNRRDIDGALSFFADDATVTSRATTFTGKDEIRKYIEAIAPRSQFLSVSDRHAGGNHVIWTERITGMGSGQGIGSQGYGVRSQVPSPAMGLPGLAGGLVSVDAVVEDGKIRSLTYVPGTQAQLRFDPSLDGQGLLPATAGLGIVVSVLAAGLVLAWVGIGRSTTAASSLRGRLLSGLQGWAAARPVSPEP
jgi:hypothetical protein